MARPRSPSPKVATATLRLTPIEKQRIAARARARGFRSLSSYLRSLDEMATELGVLRESRPTGQPSTHKIADASPPTLFLKTSLGQVMEGDSLGLLHKTLEKHSVDLIMTSPPFGLIRKKEYGNEDADAYLGWFRPFADGFRRVLKSSGSAVIDIGGSWKKGTPTRSLYHFELLIMLCREYGFHLAQEFYWWNPAKLPTPAEWVNVRRVRVKDAVNCIWWLSPTPWPKASNRRVLQPYSDSMKHLLKNGYTPKRRPSGHDISDKFQRDNLGAIPPNLIALSNTESNDAYQRYCQEHGLPRHPARYPSGIPEYFIRMLTDPGDVVVDPFAGSCVTGFVAEQLGRRWVCCEIAAAYLGGARVRFTSRERQLPGLESRTSTRRNGDVKPYEIYPPCAMPAVDTAAALRADGGMRRPEVAAKRKRARHPISTTKRTNGRPQPGTGPVVP